MKALAATLVLTILVGLPAAVDASHRPDLRLTIAAPESSFATVRFRHGIKTVNYRNRAGLLSTTQWPLIFRIESRTAVGFVARFEDPQEREALVLTDPDECLSLASLLDDFTAIPAFDPTCLAEDETYLEVQSEKFDTFGVFDNIRTGNDAIRDRLTDQQFSDPEPRNTPLLRLFNGSIKEVGPKTGGRLPPFDPANPERRESDGYGYGADDDLASIVIMADIGGSRVFDEDFDLVRVFDEKYDLQRPAIRNMAGFINTVSTEDLDGRNQSAITASMHLLAGVFEPIAIVDTDITDPSLAGFDNAMRVDSGDIVGFNLDAPFPMGSAGGLANEYYDEMLSQYYPAKVKIRAVLVNGEAPDFIYDMNGDNRYTARDVALAGYEVLSNEVSITLKLTHENLLTESPDSKCPPRTLIHSDLDGNGARGMLPDCLLTSGSVRVRRPPR